MITLMIKPHLAFRRTAQDKPLKNHGDRTYPLNIVRTITLFSAFFCLLRQRPGHMFAYDI